MRVQLLVLVAGLLAAAGCGGGICGDFCESHLQCGEDLADYYDCSLEDDDEDFVDQCKEECEEALDEMSPEEQNLFEDCAECVLEEQGDDCWAEDMYDIVDDECDAECDDDDVQEAWSEFQSEFGFEIEFECEG